ncbi:MAG: sigma-70 family RNA polymerase sigma factor [Planctomycetes bacterium]|nr:sigma-70 family RNA polymerase sigma factor [Planctomycetota bacterium]
MSSSDLGGLSWDELFTHRQWVEQLARSLVRDTHHAEEIVQETWLAALRRRPSDIESSRAWLGSVVRNFVRFGHRGETRRRRREHAAARPEPVGSIPASDALEKLETEEAVIAAVRALPEPYREAVILRYYQELTPSEMAERLGIPYENVKTRLRRGRERLRSALDDRFGPTPAWLAILVPPHDSAWTTGSGAIISNSPTPILGGLLMSKATVAVTLVAMGFAGYSWVVSRTLAEERDLRAADAARIAELGERSALLPQLEALQRDLGARDEQIEALRAQLAIATVRRSATEGESSTSVPTPVAPSPRRSISIASLGSAERAAQDAIARNDVEMLWLIAAELIQQGETGFDQIIALAHRVDSRALRNLWRHEEMLAGPFLRTFTDHLGEVLEFGLYLDRKEDDQLPKLVREFKDEIIHEIGVVMLGYYDGQDPTLLDRYVDKYRQALSGPDLTKVHRARDMLRALSQIRTDAAFETLRELLYRTDGNLNETVVQAIAWQGDERAFPTLEEFRRKLPADANVELLDAALDYLR